MIINNKFKNSRKVVKFGYKSVVSDHSTAVLNTGTTAVSINKDGKVSLTTLRLSVYVSTGIKILEQPLMLKDGIPSNPTHLDGLDAL